MKSMCFTQVPKHELVEMVVGGLDYFVRKQLDTQYLRNIAQLAYTVIQVEHMKEEKAILEKTKTNRHPRKEKVAYVETNGNNQELHIVFEYVEENQINLAELQLEPPYVCKVLRPSNGKNPMKPNKNEKFITKTYTFDITKCD